MTHGIPPDEFVYTSKPSIRLKPLTPAEIVKIEYNNWLHPRQALISELQEHLKQVSQYIDEKHSAKRNVLSVAIEVLRGTKTQDDLSKAKVDNPEYNKAFWESETQKLISQVETEVKKPKPEVPPNTKNKVSAKLSPAQENLIQQLISHYDSLKDKNDDKHSAKKAVIAVAIEVIKGNKTSDDLDKVKANNPLYSKALFTSKTEHLIEQTFKLTSQQDKKDDTNMAPK